LGGYSIVSASGGNSGGSSGSSSSGAPPAAPSVGSTATPPTPEEDPEDPNRSRDRNVERKRDDYLNDKQVKGRPERNIDQNKRVTDAAREANLNSEQRRLLGRIVERDSRAGGENYTYQDIKAIADEIKAGRSSY
jgi:hypothetical protein